MTERTGELARRLTAASDALRSLASEAELDSVRRYQGLDRAYEVVNELLRGERSQDGLTDDEIEIVQTILTGLDRLLERWSTPEPIRAYRGQRSLVRAFDLAEGDRPSAGTLLESAAFLSTTIYREVAVPEFTTPPGTGGPALLEIDIPTGTSALWVPPLGDPVLAYQGELLLPRGTRLLVRGYRDEAGILVVDCEVVS